MKIIVKEAGFTFGKKTKEKYFTDEQLIKLLQNKAKELGRTPKIYEMGHTKAIFNHFGNYSNALKKARLTKNKKDKKYSDAYLINLVKNKSKELGRAPFSTEMGSMKTTLILRFGTWKEVLKKAGWKLK